MYVNAQISIGLFQATLEQRHLDALLLFFEWKIGSDMRRRGPHPLKQCGSLRIKNLAEALSMIAMDRWNTRAWILQEAFASGGNMILLFPRAKEMAVRGWSLICHDLSLTEIGIKLDILQRCIKQSVGLFTPKPDSSIPIKLPEWIEALKRLTWFQPETSTRHMFNFWINDAKPRRTCNAAVAMSFLEHRDNDRVADRLAILANLCDYSLRLNTVELEKSQGRLSVCVLALAIANGDFSLLSPESYHIPRGLDVSMLFQTVHTTRNKHLLTANSPEQRRQGIYLGSSQRDATPVYQIEDCRSWRGDARPSLPRPLPGNKRRALTPGFHVEDRSFC